jgi:ABC-type antimicrobial peptide transport system ATPase subunit
MRHKVGIVLALATEAKALLLDEPTSGLEPAASHEFLQLLRKLAGQQADFASMRLTVQSEWAALWNRCGNGSMNNWRGNRRRWAAGAFSRRPCSGRLAMN